MDRRGFLRAMIGGVAAGAAVRSWPFRVFSFPTEIMIPSAQGLALDNSAAYLTPIYYNKAALELLKKHLQFRSVAPYNGKDYYAVVHPLQFREYVMSGVSN